MDLKFYVSLFLRRLHWFIFFLAIGSAVGIALAKVLPPVYVAQATLLVESQQIPSDLAASTVQTEPTEQLQIIQQRILTREKLLEMANRLQIYAPVAGQPVQNRAADEIVSDLRERIGIVTTGGTVPRGPVQATLVKVSFRAPTAALAASVANDVVTLILQENVAIRTGVAGQTLEFFVQEVARLDQELATRGAAILKFQEENQEAMPDSLEFRRTQQAAAQERLLQLDREESGLKDRREALVKTKDSIGLTDPAADDRNLTAEQRQLRALQDELASALALLSPQNPKVKVLQARVDALEKVVAGQITGVSPDGTQLSAFDIQLADLDGQLKSIAEQKAQVAAELEKLGNTIRATPAIAITLDTMQRDYANLRAQYDQAVANKARAETGDTIETLSKGQRISVIEQAIAPREPSKPNRPLVAAAGIGGGAALGLGLIVLMELLNTAIRRPVELTAKLGVAPFATLPYMWTAQQIRRRRAFIALALLLVLVVVPVGLWLVHTRYMPLDLLLQPVTRRLGLALLFLPAGPALL